MLYLDLEDLKQSKSEKEGERRKSCSLHKEKEWVCAASCQMAVAFAIMHLDNIYHVYLIRLIPIKLSNVTE